MAMQSLAAFRGAEAFLYAQPAAVPRCSAQRVREMGTGIAGSHVSLFYRWVAQVPKRTLPLSAISLISRSEGHHEQVTSARGRRCGGRCLRRYDPDATARAYRNCRRAGVGAIAGAIGGNAGLGAAAGAGAGLLGRLLVDQSRQAQDRAFQQGFAAGQQSR
jgi:hypothetical protein